MTGRYTGAGGNDHLGTGQQLEDQTLHNRYNKSLHNALVHKTAVRVFCAESSKGTGSKGGSRPHVYVGLYTVAACESKPGLRGPLVSVNP